MKNLDQFTEYLSTVKISKSSKEKLYKSVQKSQKQSSKPHTSS